MENHNVTKELYLRMENTCLRGWKFAKYSAYATSLFLFLVAAALVVDTMSFKPPQSIICGVVVLVYIIVNALVVCWFYKEATKQFMVIKGNGVRRNYFPKIDGNPNIRKAPANVMRLCAKCLEYADPPELISIHNHTINTTYYQVRCPKCWCHTAFFEYKKDAENAWNAHEYSYLKESE